MVMHYLRSTYDVREIYLHPKGGSVLPLLAVWNHIACLSDREVKANGEIIPKMARLMLVLIYKGALALLSDLYHHHYFFNLHIHFKIWDLYLSQNILLSTTTQHEVLCSVSRPPGRSCYCATVEVVKHASVSDKAFGYASQNGGTSGGAGGTTTTVSTYAQFTKALSGTAKKVVIVSGPIRTAAVQVKVSSDTSIIGKSSVAKLTGFGV